MLDLPTYDALLHGSTSDPRYALRADYRQSLTQTFRDVKGFWDIQSGDIQLHAMHGSMMQDADRVARVYREVYGLSPAAAAARAQDVANAVSTGFDGGNNALFTLNAFAFTAEGDPDPLVAGLPDKLIFGDGILDALQYMGIGDIGPRAVMGHEFGHHVQYEDNLFDSPLTGAEATRRTELMADAFGTYFATHARGLALNAKRVLQVEKSFYEVGDCAFADPGHHGTPNQRLRASTWAAGLADAARPQGKILPSLTFADHVRPGAPGDRGAGRRLIHSPTSTTAGPRSSDRGPAASPAKDLPARRDAGHPGRGPSTLGESGAPGPRSGQEDATPAPRPEVATMNLLALASLDAGRYVHWGVIQHQRHQPRDHRHDGGGLRAGPAAPVPAPARRRPRRAPAMSSGVTARQATRSRSWTVRLREWISGLVPPGQALPDRQPAYVASWIYTFGVLSLAALVVVIGSGLALAVGGAAWWHESSLGHFVNSLHLWSVELFFAVMVIHLWGKFWMAAWRGKRGLTWISGVVAFVASIGAAFTGYLSQSNFDAQWISAEAKDGINSIGVGAWFNVLNPGQMLLWHVVLTPLTIGVIVVWHVILVRRHGVVPPLEAGSGEERGD